MSFVRTTTFSMTREDAEEIRQGKLVYNALVSGRKFICQAIDGLVQTFLWKASSPVNGRVVFTIFTEWATMEDLQNYVTQPTIKKLEEELAKETGQPLEVVIYENLG